MALKIKTPPATEPVTLQEVKDYLRLTDAVDNSLLTGMLTAIRQACEDYTRRALVTQTWALWLDRFPRSEKANAPGEGYFQLPVSHFDDVKTVIEIPRPPLQSITYLKTYDTANTVSTFDAANYFVDINSEPGRIALNQGKSWPSNLRAFSAVEIEFVAGYGLASAIPAVIKEGMMLWIKILKASQSKLFETEQDETVALTERHRKMTIPPQVEALWGPYQIKKL